VKEIKRNKREEEERRGNEAKALSNCDCDQSLQCSLFSVLHAIKRKIPKKNVWLIFFIILLKDIFYIIILLFFLFLGFKRGYGMTEWSDFISTEIKRCYNTNDRWKFILFFIRRENDLNR